jgi:DNA-binding transcriptional MerR regulator
MRIGEIAERVGVNPRTIRFYESIGIIPEPPHTPGGLRETEGEKYCRSIAGAYR